MCNDTTTDCSAVLQRGDTVLHPNDLQRLQRYVAAGCPPQTESLLADAHIFWWDTSGAEDADFAIVNRNGNLARAFQKDGVWTLYKNLGKAGACLNPESWERSGISSLCLRECAQKMWLQDAADEKLTFLPKELTAQNSRRKVIVRDRLFTFRGFGNEAFKLELGGVMSPEFRGKPWENRQAVEWAIARCQAPDAPKSAEAILEQAVLAASVANAEVALAEIWGQF
jgi:hypothetical protein